MKFELYLVVSVGILVTGILYLVYLNPNEMMYYSSFQNPEFDTIGSDYHLEPLGDNEKHWATISNIALIDDQTISIVFRGNNPNSNNTMSDYKIPNDFAYSHLVKKGQTFIPVCMGGYGVLKDNIRQDEVVFLQYMGVVQLSGAYYYKFYHTNAVLPQGLTCKYPQIIQHGFDADFDIKEYAPFQKFFSNGRWINNNTNSSMVVNIDQPCKVLECKYS